MRPSPHRAVGRPRRARRLARAAALVALAVAACSPPPVEWGEPVAVETDAGAGWGTLALGEGEAPRLVEPAAAATLPAGACPGSVRVARGPGDERLAVWWAVRPDSSAALLAARSTDGGRRWSASVPVDSTDRHRRGCARPAPSVAYDAASGYVHTAYWLEGAEGPGIFFSHSMEREPMLFHEPVPIVYGERPAQTAVAAEGGTVAVAFQDPNARTSRIAVRISRSDGHIFEHWVGPITSPADSAYAPRVAVRGRRLAVAWRGGTHAPGAAGREVSYLRTGTLR